jgi:16S rRNA (cytidine1402-2'-O)-methyltransferase
VGRLVLVATPIGNLGDLSPRAIAALAEADAVVCEDTRRTGRLLQHAGVRAPRLIVANEHTEHDAAKEIVRLLDDGANVAVVTDAGTPGISDPGERLVRAALDAGHEIGVVPGPVAAVAALVASGLPTARFVMEGFLPRTGRERGERIDVVARELRTVVLYEAPHRLVRTLTDLVTACGADRAASLARELTKLHEEIWRGTLAEAVTVFTEREPIGEFVIVLAGAPETALADDDVLCAALEAALATGATRKDAVAEVAAAHGVARNRVYDLAVNRPTPHR